MKILKIIGLGLLLILLSIALLFGKKIKRLYTVNHMFDESTIVDNFQDAEEIFNSSELPASSQPKSLAKVNTYQLPTTFTSKNKTYQLQEFLDKTRTEGFLVIHKDTIIYEAYHRGLDLAESHISWSMAKSFIGTLVGIAVDKKLMTIHDKITDHLPEFKGTGYSETTVENLLHMSSGVRFNEDYADFNSDINRFGRTFAMGTSFKEFSMSLKAERTPGTYNKYVSIDTQVLGYVVSQATGMSLTELLSQWIWEPMGMEHAAQWIIDDTGFELALGGLNASLRDFAKLGLMYLHNGRYNGRQIVSAAWVAKATTPHAPHLMPNQTEHSSTLFGYGYQWWIPQFPDNDFFAVGIYDQFLYIHRDKELVIAKLSADHNFTKDTKAVKAKHIDMFQSMARNFVVE